MTLQDFLALQDRFREDLWHYRFHALEPNDEGRISTEDFLKANLVALKSSDAPKYRNQIKKIAAQLGESDPGVTLGEFIAFQYFFERLDSLKAKCATVRYLDYSTFLDVIEDFCNSDPYCRENKVAIGEHIAKSVFLLIDLDESGEIEPAELMVFDRAVMGQSREVKAKQDAEAQFRAFLKTLDGYKNSMLSIFS